MNSRVTNFGKNVISEPVEFCSPTSEAELLDCLRRNQGKRFRVVASKHAWSAGIQTDGVLVSLEKMNSVIVDETNQTASVGAGCQVKHLLNELRKFGLTLPSLGLIDEQTIGGATATGTHGSGKHSMSHYVVAIRLAHFDRETNEPVIRWIDDTEPVELMAARCSMGLLGIVVEVKIKCRPTYDICEVTRRHQTLDEVLAAESETPLQQFYLMPWSWHWFVQHRHETDQPRSRLAGLYRLYWYLTVDWGLHLVVVTLVKLLKMQWMMGAFFRYLLPLTFVQNWKVVDDSHKMLVMEHELFRHIEFELFVIRTQLAPALEFLKSAIIVFAGKPLPGDQSDLAELLEPFRGSYFHHYAICVRRILPDDTLISMASPFPELANEGGAVEDCYAISLISYERNDERDGFFAFAELIATEMTERFQARAHWGKFNPLTKSQTQQLYPRLDEFKAVMKKFDPNGSFSNHWLQDVMK